MNYRKNLRKASLYLVIGISLILIGFVVFTLKKPEVVTVIPSPTPAPVVTFSKVLRVIDGDTIVIDGGQKVRYIGMNTPEVETNDCFANEATKANKDLVLGKEIHLEKGISETDKYGRLLRYVYVGEQFVNDELVKNGFAKVETVQPNVKYKDEFISSQNYARENKLGLWKSCIN
jgi:micrococcal nuclease